MKRRAYFSACRTWRYLLTRQWDEGGMVAFIGLNPSTADEMRDDPTVRRCINFARSWGYGKLAMLNLYAFRATDSRVLLKSPDPFGPDNNKVIGEVVADADLVICAWGNPGHGIRAARVLDIIAQPHCLGVTKLGAPRHPLYVPADTRPIPYIS
jgi:hypothetical protein